MPIQYSAFLIAAISGLALEACSPTTTPSNIHLEARDTIVEFGRHRVVIPRSNKCDWVLNSTTSAPEASIWFYGCGEHNSSVTTGAKLFDGIDRLDKEWFDGFMAAARFNVEHDCSIRRLREGQIGKKRWVLCEGPSMTSNIDTHYRLHVVLEEEEYYFDFLCEIGAEYFKTFEASGEIERIVNAVQVWGPDE